MKKNSFIIYSEVTDVYKKLLLYLSSKGFKVKESKEQFFSLKAKKNSILFWRNLRMELHIQSVEKKKAEITTMLYKNGVRQLQLESEYSTDIKSYLESLKQQQA